MNLLNELPEVTVRTVEEYQPPFDDILVTLLQQEDARHV